MRASKCLDSIIYEAFDLALFKKLPNFTGTRFSNSLAASGVLYGGGIDPDSHC